MVGIEATVRLIIRSIANLIREMQDTKIARQKQAVLYRAALALLGDYVNDTELTVFQNFEDQGHY